MAAEVLVGFCIVPACWTPLALGSMPGRELVSEMASDLLPGVTEAAEFIDGRAKGLSCRLSIRLPEPESFDWQPANVRPASIMLTEPKAFVIPMTSFPSPA